MTQHAENGTGNLMKKLDINFSFMRRKITAGKKLIPVLQSFLSDRFFPVTDLKIVTSCNYTF